MLGDREPLLHRPLAQLDVVLGRAGEVLEQVAVGVRRDDPQVDRDPVVGRDPRPRRARRSPPGRRARARSAPSPSAFGSLAVAIRSMSLQVSARRRAEPATVDRVAGRVLAQRRRQLLGDGQHLGEQQALGRPLLAELRQRREHVLLGLRPEPLEPADPLALGRRAQVVEARRRRARRRAGAPSSRRGPGIRVTSISEAGNLAFSFVAEGISPVSTRATIFSCSVVADPGQLGRLAGQRQLLDRDRALADHPRRLPVGEHPVADRAVELVQGRRARSSRRRSRRFASASGADSRLRAGVRDLPASGSSCRPTTRPRTSRRSSRAIREQLPAERRVLVVDDASPDGTGEIADRLAADPRRRRGPAPRPRRRASAPPTSPAFAVRSPVAPS